MQSLIQWYFTLTRLQNSGVESVYRKFEELQNIYKIVINIA